MAKSRNSRSAPPRNSIKLLTCAPGTLKNGNPKVLKKQTPKSLANKQAKKSHTNGDKSSAADKLVNLALQRYRIGRTDTDEAFAVAIGGANVALMFRGSRDALRLRSRA